MLALNASPKGLKTERLQVLSKNPFGGKRLGGMKGNLYKGGNPQPLNGERSEGLRSLEPDARNMQASMVSGKVSWSPCHMESAMGTIKYAKLSSSDRLPWTVLPYDQFFPNHWLFLNE